MTAEERIQLEQELRIERGRRAAAEEARAELNVKLNAIGGGSMTTSEVEEACWRAAIYASQVMDEHGLRLELFAKVKAFYSKEREHLIVKDLLEGS